MHHIYRLWPVIASIAVLGLSSGPAKAREIVTTPPGYSAGTIVIHTSERKLYYYVDSTHAIRYPVGVGRAGMQWGGHILHRREVPQPGLVAA
jgi:lipoprotein-anchoring transpeptidase ErfK/SrfK